MYGWTEMFDLILWRGIPVDVCELMKCSQALLEGLPGSTQHEANLTGVYSVFWYPRWSLGGAGSLDSCHVFRDLMGEHSEIIVFAVLSELLRSTNSLPFMLGVFWRVGQVVVMTAYWSTLAGKTHMSGHLSDNQSNLYYRPFSDVRAIWRLHLAIEGIQNPGPGF